MAQPAPWTVKTGKLASTSVEGVFAAGDAAYDVQQIAEAVAEGVKAAIAIHKSLRKEDFR
jgi:thioredoxin reductase